MSNADEIARAFLNFYYPAFSSDRKQLASLFTDNSMLTYEGKQFKGQAKIMEQLLEGLSFKSIIFRGETTDAQWTVGDGIIVFVTGFLQLDGENEFRFSETFNLQPIPGGNGYYVLNDFFRIQM